MIGAIDHQGRALLVNKSCTQSVDDGFQRFLAKIQRFLLVRHESFIYVCLDTNRSHRGQLYGLLMEE